MAASRERYKVLSGHCPDEKCQAKLYFPSHESSIECPSCGQRHEQKSLRNIEHVTNPDVALHNLLRNVLLGNTKPKKGTDSVRVLGLSNYQCKLLSPLLTEYGMDKRTGKAKPLVDMGSKGVFDCGVLADRTFQIETEHLNVVGYGRDRTGSMRYLGDTLDALKKANDGEERLVPIHADGDGHCLVHAVSRCLVGRELFWHALRVNLRNHFEVNLDKYKALFNDFIDQDEWADIIAECDPGYTPENGEALGLRNIHVFGLANVLRRPIILLDSMLGMKSSGDYSAIFLPGLQPIEKCSDKDSALNKPLCIAWSSSGYNHYIPLVPVKGRREPILPSWILPKVWGLPEVLLADYINLDQHGNCEIDGNKCLQDKYIQRLVKAMEEVFIEKYKVQPSLVADVHQYVFKSTGMVGVRPEVVLEATQKAISEHRLYRCLQCEAITEITVDPNWLKPGGSLYRLAETTHGELKSDKKYTFPMQGLVCDYDDRNDSLVLDTEACRLKRCSWCPGTSMRHVRGDGSILYVDGDRTMTPAPLSKCQCGFKHYWKGAEYDNLPEIIPISLEWTGQVIAEKVDWFQYESDVSLNSNVYEKAQAVVQKHFPGEFGSERLVQKVVDTIMRQTTPKTQPGNEETELLHIVEGVDDDPAFKEDRASKIILTGNKKKTIHKEELVMSQTEKSIQARIHRNAAVSQRRKSLENHDRQSQPEAPISPRSLDRSHVSDSVSLDAMSALTGNKIRLTTSDGRQTTWGLEVSCTYQQLTDKIEVDLKIPKKRQKIRYGFPPKELHPPQDENENETLPFSNGDRVSVEILPDPDMQSDHRSSTRGQHRPPLQLPKQAWSNLHVEERDQSAEDMLKGLSELQGNADSLDMAISSLSLMATLSGRDLWSYVQTMPHLFSVGGLYYCQTDRDLGLVDGKHCTLPSLPGKVFRYSSTDDRLELCLEPHGHFPVEPGIEDKVLNSGLIEKLSAHTEASKDAFHRLLSSGSLGVMTNPVMKVPITDAHVPFQGEGHSLGQGQSLGMKSTNIRMPSDILPNEHRRRAVKLNDFTQNTPSPDIIVEEEEIMDADANLKRMGPGYSVLDPEKCNDVNARTDLLKNLAETIHAGLRTSDDEMENFDLDEEMDSA